MNRMIVAMLALFPAPLLAQQAAPAAPEPAPAAPAAQPEVTDTAGFVQLAASSNRFEIESSQLALERSQKDEVIAFAKQMVDDHTAAAEQMQTAAEEAKIALPQEMGDEDRAKLEELRAAEDFDAAYIAAQTEAHDKAVALFSSFAQDGEDGPMKQFAAETLPVLEQHQQHVRGLSAGN